MAGFEVIIYGRIWAIAEVMPSLTRMTSKFFNHAPQYARITAEIQQYSPGN